MTIAVTVVLKIIIIIVNLLFLVYFFQFHKSIECRIWLTITFSLPIEMGNDIEKMAQEEQRTVSELIREAIRQYRSKKAFRSLALESRAAAKRKGLSSGDFGGPFED